MKFLLDENFPKAAITLLERFGHEWQDSRGTDLEGSEDACLVETAQTIGAVLLTTDRDFFHTLRHQYPNHAGLVVIALKQPNRTAILERLQWLLETIGAEHFRGRAFQLRDKTWVAQPPLPE